MPRTLHQLDSYVNVLAGKFNASPVISGITALTGDGTASGPGSSGLTLATVLSNPGTFNNATITVDGKGRITSIQNGTSHLTGYTVATLPTGAQGDTAFVTDATNPTYLGALTGGGTVVTPVFHNGTTWRSY